MENQLLSPFSGNCTIIINRKLPYSSVSERKSQSVSQNANSKIYNVTENDVSVIIPHYNSSDTISRAVNSVLGQTRPVLEVLIVDDGSTSREKKKLESISSLDPKVRIIFLEKNKGPASARNVGWNAAKGGWIAFLDADDAWHPRKIEIQMDIALQLNRSISLVGSEIGIITGESKLRGCRVREVNYFRISFWQLLLKNRFSTPTVLLKSDLPFRFTEGRKYAEDYELWIRILGAGGTAIRINYPLAYIFKEPYGQSGLSSHMMAMSFGELETFLLLYKSNVLNAPQFIIASIFSFVKSARRLIFTFLHRLSLRDN